MRVGGRGYPVYGVLPTPETCVHVCEVVHHEPNVETPRLNERCVTLLESEWSVNLKGYHGRPFSKVRDSRGWALDLNELKMRRLNTILKKQNAKSKHKR